MKRILLVILGMFALLICVDSLLAQQREPAITRIPVRSDSRLWLEGSSNVRDWTCKATSLDATIEVSNDATTASTLVKGVSVRVPVRSLKCGDRHMEAHMYDALKSSSAEPGFITAEVDRIPQSVVTGQASEAEAKLTIAGVQRTVKMTVTSDLLPDGTRRARGTVPILMTDFGISPPRPWGGLLRTADRVLIQFEIFVAHQ